MSEEQKADDIHLEEKHKCDSDENDRTIGCLYLEHQAKMHRKLIRKMDWRILPLCAFIYLINYLDRSNIGNAKILNSETGDSLLQQTAMTANGYSLVVSLFAVAYTLFDVPSNWVMKRYVRPSRWLGTLFICWGALTLGFAAVKTYAAVVVLRFFIGVFEAGFFPGIVYLITFWYRPDERSVRIALVIASASLAGAFGGFIAYGSSFLNQKAGLEGFRWLFIIEGIATLLVSLLILFCLPDFPSNARWLSEDEKTLAAERLGNQTREHMRERASLKDALETCKPRMLVHYFIYFLNTVSLSSLSYFTPTIVNGMGYTSTKAQLMTVPPWVVCFVISLILAWCADHFNARGYLIFVANMVAGAGFVAITLLPMDASLERYGCLMLAACGAFPSASPLTAWVTCNIPSAKVMGLSAALNNSVVGIATIISLWIWIPSEAVRGYPTGNIICAVCSFVTGFLALSLSVYYRNINRKTCNGTRLWMC